MLVALVVVDRSSGNRSLAVKDPGNPAADLGKQGGQALQQCTKTDPGVPPIDRGQNGLR